MNNFAYDYIENKIRYKFNNRALLYNAFVHSSYANENNIADNERMEFFGDAILQYVVSKYLYEHFPDMDAGELSKSRASVVSSIPLKIVVDKLDIDKHIMMSSNSVKTARKSKKLEANLFEAIVCAISYDGGLDKASEFILDNLDSHLSNCVSNINKDYKTKLQELCHSKKLNISYNQVDRSGPDNSPIFVCSVSVGGYTEHGKGGSIKYAQTDAAKKMYERLILD